MISMTKRVQEKQVKFMPYELVKDFQIPVYLGDKLQFERTVTGNIERLSVTDIPDGVTADKITVSIHSTHGYKNARVFEIRLY